MCGRYASAKYKQQMIELFDADVAASGIAPERPGPDAVDGPGVVAPEEYQNFNVAPTQVAPVVLQRAARVLRGLRWGLVPHWSKDVSAGARMINARSETVLEKRSFARPILTQRCLVPMEGWFEWSGMVQLESGKIVKQPHYLTRPGDDWAAAGIYALWPDPAKDPADAHRWLATFSVLTRSASPELASIHDRMPVLLGAPQWDAWLDPQLQDPDAVAGMIGSAITTGFQTHTVHPQVNAARATGADLILPWSPTRHF